MLNGKLKNRKRNRWHGYDYARDGLYFVTICVKNREKCLGKIENNEMILNENGKIVEKCWQDLPDHYKNCILDEFIIMPNHVHGVVVIDNDITATSVVVGMVGTGFASVGTGFKPVPTPTTPTTPTTPSTPTSLTMSKHHSLSEIMRGFKTFSSRRINEINLENIFHWQRSFYDHIIRDENSLNHIRQYIRNNPTKWAQDRNNQEDLYM